MVLRCAFKHGWILKWVHCYLTDVEIELLYVRSHCPFDLNHFSCSGSSVLNLTFLHFGPSVSRVFFLSLLFIFHLLSNIYCFKSHVASSVGKHSFFIKTFWEKKSGNAFMRARNQPTLSVS